MIRAHRGFTLMETLVMLVLVSFAVLLMFQMLGSYRIARERVAAQAGGIDRQALFDAWFRDSVHGLRALEGSAFEGDAGTFAGLSLNPLFATRGATVPMRWTLEQAGDGAWWIAYEEAGEPRFRLPLAGTGMPRFAYFDEAGERHDVWPPGLGEQRALPASVAIVRAGDGRTRTVVASVQGNLDPYYNPFELWEGD